MSNFVKITVPGNPEYIKICENAAIKVAAISGLDLDTVEEVGMAVFEACKNIACHGHDCWCSEYEMEIETTDKYFKINLVSVGEHSIEKCETICLDCPNEGNLGLAIINSVMDDVHMESDGKCNKKIVMVKNLC